MWPWPRARSMEFSGHWRGIFTAVGSRGNEFGCLLQRLFSEGRIGYLAKGACFQEGWCHLMLWEGHGGFQRDQVLILPLLKSLHRCDSSTLLRLGDYLRLSCWFTHTITGVLEGQRGVDLIHKSRPREDVRQRHKVAGLQVWRNVVTCDGTQAVTRDWKRQGANFPAASGGNTALLKSDVSCDSHFRLEAQSC